MREYYNMMAQARADQIETILSLLENFGGNRAAVARHLGVAKSTLHDKLKELGFPKKHKNEKLASTKNIYYVYIITSPADPNIYKIGRTKNLERRLKSLNTGVPFPYEPVKLIYCYNQSMMNRIERRLHAKFWKQRIKKTEFFKLSTKDLLNLSQEL